MKVSILDLLTFNGGYVDTAGFLALQGLFTAHVTGNFVTIGASLVQGTSGVIAKLLALPVFCAVVVLTRAFSDRLPREGRTAVNVLIAVKVMLFVAAAAIGSLSGSVHEWRQPGGHRRRHDSRSGDGHSEHDSPAVPHQVASNDTDDGKHDPDHDERGGAAAWRPCARGTVHAADDEPGTREEHLCFRGRMCRRGSDLRGGARRGFRASAADRDAGLPARLPLRYCAGHGLMFSLTTG